MAKTQTFFEKRTDQSRVKTRIVIKYLRTWSRVIKATADRYHEGRIAYVDLFSGPGRYEDGEPSTPLNILQEAISQPHLRNHLSIVFNDANPDHVAALKKEIEILAGIETLKRQPQTTNHQVGDAILEFLEKRALPPTFMFVDPWGYKDLSLRLIHAAIKDWGCDCLFFFNYNRIMPALLNALVEGHMDDLFGEVRAEDLKARITLMSGPKKEQFIVASLIESIREIGGEYVVSFRFLKDRGTRISHHLIFVSKHDKGYEIMKDIMAAESSSFEQDVPSYTFWPADEVAPTLPLERRLLDQLVEALPRYFAGEKVSTVEIFKRHHIGRHYVKRNYKEALRILEHNGLVQVSPSAKSRRKGKDGKVSFPDNALVTFPSRE